MLHRWITMFVVSSWTLGNSPDVCMWVSCPELQVLQSNAAVAMPCAGVGHLKIAAHLVAKLSLAMGSAGILGFYTCCARPYNSPKDDRLNTRAAVPSLADSSAVPPVITERPHCCNVHAAWTKLV